MEHYTNVYRMWHLASEHPLVSDVTTHKLKTKSKDKTVKDTHGRAIKGHQNPFDLKITFESGRAMCMGHTVHGVAEELAAFWWRPGKGVNSHPTERLKARAVFFDIAEALHQEPILGEKWRQAWEEGKPSPLHFSSSP